MRIGIDIDNVIADLDKTFLEEFEKEDKNKIYYFTKEQIKKSKKECRRLKIKYIFNEKFPVFFDIIDINHVIIHMLIIEMLIGKITGIENDIIL
mgnify:CR=1 FL=1